MAPMFDFPKFNLEYHAEINTHKKNNLGHAKKIMIRNFGGGDTDDYDEASR